MRPITSILTQTARLASTCCYAPRPRLPTRSARRWFWPSPTSMSGAVSPTTATLSPPTHTFHVLLIRHAESYNNVLAERLQHQHGDSPYSPNAARSLVLEYDRARKIDPDLSLLGLRQANLLPEHPHLLDCRWVELARAGRLRVLTSPMLRTVQTSLPLLRRIDDIQRGGGHHTSDSPPRTTQQLPEDQLATSVNPSALPAALGFKAALHPDFCERGGYYKTVGEGEGGEAKNVRSRGMGRAALTAEYGNSHVADRCGEDGWWNNDSPGEELEDEYFPRVERAITYTLTQAALYHQHYHSARKSTTPPIASPQPSNAESHTADYMLVVSHADFIDSFVTRLLQVRNHGRPKHCFYASNTSVTHLELAYAPPHQQQGGARQPSGGGGAVRLPSEGVELAEVLRDYEVRVRCVNSLPRRVPAGDPPADDTVKGSNNHSQ